MGESVLLRCPVGPRRLLAIVRAQGQWAPVTSDNLIEFACKDCAWKMRKDGDISVKWVLHRFNFIGELIENEIQHEE